MQIKQVEIYIDSTHEHSYTGKTFPSMLKACQFVHKLARLGADNEVWVCAGNYNLYKVEKGETLNAYYTRMKREFHKIFG